MYLWHASHQQMRVFALEVPQHQPIGINKDLGKTLTNMAAAVIHKCVHHLKDLGSRVTQFINKNQPYYQSVDYTL